MRRVQRQRDPHRRAAHLAAARRRASRSRCTWSGARASTYYRFRNRPIEASWTGFSEQPTFADAREIGATLIDAFVAGADDVDERRRSRIRAPDGVLGVDELHIVHTQFRSLMTQTPVANFLAPMQVVETEVERGRAAAGVRVRAGPGGAARRAAAEVHQHAYLRGVASTRRRASRRPAGGP